MFLYDSLDYGRLELKDLEDFLSQPEMPSVPHTDAIMLTKVVIPQKLGREVMEWLDVMNISGTYLYDDHEGAAIDVIIIKEACEIFITSSHSITSQPSFWGIKTFVSIIASV